MGIETKNILEENLGELFGMETMTDEERTDLLDGVGASIIESSLLRYVTSGNALSLDAFELFLDKHADDEELLPKLLEKFPDFQSVLSEEVAAFKTEAAAVLGGA